MIKLTLDQVRQKLLTLYGGDVRVDESTYINTSSKARFISDLYGEWLAKPNDVFNGHLNYKAGWANRQITCLKKYGQIHPSKVDAFKEKKKKTLLRNFGVDNPNKHLDISLRIARNSNNSHILYHWKTGETLVCVGSYEKRTVEYLNNNNIEFLWQPRTFSLPNGKTYRPDLYLISQDQWVEIKGYMRRDAQDKWDWFHRTYPNSELWNQEKLVKLSIL